MNVGVVWNRRSARTWAIAMSGALAIGVVATRASAQQVMEARVAAVRGTVLGAGGGTLAEHATLGAEQHVVTRDDGSADLELPGGLRVGLHPRSNLVLFAPAAPAPRGETPSHDTTLARGRAHLEMPGGTAARVSFATPSGVLALDAGDIAEVRVDAGRSTRVVVEHGTVRVRGAGREVAARVGEAVRIDPGRPPVVVPLPSAPSWVAPFAARTFTAGAPVDLHATIAAQRGRGPAVVRWHLQLARDEAFRDVAVDSYVPASHLAFEAHGVVAGTYFARVRPVDPDALEGPPSPTVRVVVAAPRVHPGGQGHRASIEVPSDFFCGLDGGPLATGGAELSLAPGRAHVLRCASDERGTDAREIPISATDSGPLVHEVHLDPEGFDASGGLRVLVLRLSDGGGAPFAYANIRVDASPGVSVEPMREGDRRGVYTSTVRWSRGTTGLRLHFTVNEAEQFDYALGDAR